MDTLGRMIMLVALGCAQMAVLGQTGPATRPASEEYKLVWADEFNKDGALDPKDWAFEQGFVRNQELQWYQPENAVCKGGFLVIEARRETKPNPRYAAPGAGSAGPGTGAWQNRPTIEYTSASVNTRGKHAWLYGRFEIRAKIDVRSGSWPAFWTLGTQGGWPANGEVDIMEYYRGMLLANVAWAGGAQSNGQSWNTLRQPTANFPADWAEEFHTWRMDWDEAFIRLYVDEKLVNTQDLSKTINAPPRGGRGRTGPAVAPATAPGAAAPARGRGRGQPALENPFHGPAYLLLNQAIGGTQGGDPSNTDFPVRFQVDYVRVWQTPAQIAATAKAVQPAGAPATAPASQSAK